MAWIRLSDDYTDHPKFRDLSDGAFRLWHQALAFSRKFKTDGIVPLRTLRQFTAYSLKRMRELLTPCQSGAQALWADIPGVGVKFHDYLDWNASKDEDEERRSGSRDDMRRLRDERRTKKGTPTVSAHAPPVSTNTPRSVSTNTPLPVNRMLREGKGGIGDLEKDPEKNCAPNVAIDPELAFEERAGRFREDTYPQLYAKHRHGARLLMLANSVEFHDAVRLVKQWDDARLVKLAVIVLTTDDDWIAKTDRSFKIFALKASWADDKLAAWEVAQQAKA